MIPANDSFDCPVALVMEGCPEVRAGLATQLCALGYVVVEAGDTAVALDLLFRLRGLALVVASCGDQCAEGMAVVRTALRLGLACVVSADCEMVASDTRALGAQVFDGPFPPTALLSLVAPVGAAA
ncbi:MAG TPA: hypothetical protein VEY95_11055 [Azospirillaceae bacterium]|nr:hypothetical protein [Azospirillaceae bacterium]